MILISCVICSAILVAAIQLIPTNIPPGLTGPTGGITLITGPTGQQGIPGQTGFGGNGGPFGKGFPYLNPTIFTASFGGGPPFATGTFYQADGPTGNLFSPAFVIFSGQLSWPDTPEPSGALTIQSSLVRNSTDAWPLMINISTRSTMPVSAAQIIAVSDPASSPYFQVFKTSNTGGPATQLTASDLSVGGILLSNQIQIQGIFPSF